MRKAIEWNHLNVSYFASYHRFLSTSLKWNKYLLLSLSNFFCLQKDHLRKVESINLVVTFKAVDEMLERGDCGLLDNKLLSGSFLSVVLLLMFPVQGGSNFWLCGWNPQVWPKLVTKCLFSLCQAHKIGLETAASEWTSQSRNRCVSQFASKDLKI